MDPIIIYTPPDKRNPEEGPLISKDPHALHTSVMMLAAAADTATIGKIPSTVFC